MNTEKMVAVIKALPKCSNCKCTATQEYSHYTDHWLLCDFHASQAARPIPDPDNTVKFLPDPDVSDLEYAAELRALFPVEQQTVIHESGPII